jgi:hypothetical protein
MIHAFRAAWPFVSLITMMNAIAHDSTSDPDTPVSCKWSDPAFACEAVVELRPAVVTVGSSFIIASELRSGSAMTVYNGFLWESYKLPAKIVIHSSDGSLRRELLRPRLDSKGAGPRAWMPRGLDAGRELIVNVRPERPDPSPRERFLDLPPGKYVVQATYTHLALAGKPAPNPETGAINPYMPNTFSRSEADVTEILAVSDAVPLEIRQSPFNDNQAQTQLEAPLNVELSPRAISEKFGRRTKIRITIANRSDYMVDCGSPPFGCSLGHTYPVEIVVLKPDGTFAGDLLSRSHGSVRSMSPADWIRIPPGGTISSEFQFLAGRFHDISIPDLVPGRYLVEVRVHGHLILGPPRDLRSITLESLSRTLEHSNPFWPFGTLGGVKLIEEPAIPPDDDRSPTYAEWQQTFPGPEICRSNRVELEILPRTGD